MLNPLLVPCGDPAAVEAALRSGADALVLDLGDPDAPGDRAARRGAVSDVLALRRVGFPSLVVRIAPLASGLADADLDAVMAGAPDAVLLPGAVGGRDLQHLAAKLAVREAVHALAAGSSAIIAVPADTAAGVLALPTLAIARPRLVALAWDPAALAAALGIAVGASPVRAARDLLLLAAAAAGIPALDCGVAGNDVSPACAGARRDGFAGRLARGPAEPAIIAAAFGRPRQGCASPPR
jgi:citrate lyase subunit beta/citryl-CoA lyase